MKLALNTMLMCLEKIGRVGKLQDIKYIFSFCFHEDILVANATAEYIKAIIEKDSDKIKYSETIQKLYRFEPYESDLIHDLYATDLFFGWITLSPKLFPEIYRLKTENQIIIAV